MIERARAGYSTRSGLVVAAFGLVGAGLLYALLKGELEPIAYLVMLVAAAAALVLETRWSLAVVIFFTAISGFIKLLANYSSLAHLDNDVVYLMFLAGYVARHTVTRDVVPHTFPFRRTIYLLIGASVVLSVAPMTTIIQALGGWKSYVLPALVVLPVTSDLRREGSIQPLVWALILAGVLNASVTLFELAQGRDAVAAWGPGFARVQNVNAFDVRGVSTWRPPGMTSDGGGGAPIDAEAIALCIMIATSRVNLLVRGAMVAAAGLCMLSLFQEGVRTSVVEAGIGSIMAIYLNRGGRRLPSLLIGLGLGYIAFSTLGSAFSASTVTANRLSSLADPQSYFAARGQLLLYIPQTFVDHPLGVGMGQSIPAAGLLSRLAGATRFQAASENMLLGMMLELGWAGAVVVLSYTYQVIRAGWRYLRSQRVSIDVEVCLVLVAELVASGLSGDVFVIAFSAIQVWVLGAVLINRCASLGLEPAATRPAPAVAVLGRSRST